MNEIQGIDTKEILAGIQEWVAIESPTDTPQTVNAMMDRVQADFSALGAKTERIPRKKFGDCMRVRSPWGGDGPGILVIAHLDTVHPVGTLERLPIRVEGDRAYGPGIYDMKGGAYLAFHAFRHLVRQGRQTELPITFLFNSDEEQSSEDSRPLIEEEATRQKYVLVPEPCRSLDAVTTGRKGTARFTIDFIGRPAHSGSRHQEGRSAIKEMARQILEIETMTDYERGLTVNVGIVSGGTRMNVIPEFARMYVDMRVPTREIAEEAVARVRALKPVDPDVKIVIDGGPRRPPFERTPHGLALFETTKALATEFGMDLHEVQTGGASDANFTSPVIPTLDGLGVDGAGAHTMEEHLLIPSIAPRCGLILRLFENLR